ncbi:MAG: hypothetical protein EBS29_08610 [Chloroflexia bacterium]|nr:hypothetical protein [Chloroflexia bacterium]
MEAQVSNAIYQLNERMDADKVNAFNEAIQGIVNYMQDNCGQHNCLNATTVRCVCVIFSSLPTPFLFNRSSPPSATAQWARRA